MTFDYLYTVQATGQVDIEDIGNVCLSAINTAIFQEYILIIRTELGRSKIIQYGPRYIDHNLTPLSVTYTYNDIEFSMSKLERTIDNFLNNPKHMISQVEQITLDEAREKIKDLVSFL